MQWIYSGATGISVRGGDILGVGLVGGPRGGAPRTPENLRKFSKNFLRKSQKCIILPHFSKKLTDPDLIFRAFGQKTQLFGKLLRILRKFS